MNEKPSTSTPPRDERTGDGAASGDAPAEDAATDESSTEKAAAEEPAEAEVLRAERDEVNDRLLRHRAEFQNYRRRAEEEKGRLTASTKTRTLRPLLGVLDDFERTMDAAEQFDDLDDAEAAYQSLREGVALVLRKLHDELAKLGVEAINAKGEPFDEAEHEALMQQPAPEGVEPGTVLEEVQRGYRLGDRVLRHSRVVVAQ